jgi:NADH-quinone oxidoreductase subunit D
MVDINTEGQLDTVQMMVNMGPQHPSTHGVFRMVLWVDGERIVDLEPHIGYLHRGSEKLCEGELYAQIVTLFDRLDYISNLNNEMVFCRAVEKLMGLEVPERAEYIRVILCELNRVASHLLFSGTFGIDAGAMTPIMYAFRDREKIQTMFEAVTGARMMHNYIRIGGVKGDVPDDFSQRMGALLKELRQGIDETDRLLSFSEIFLARTKGVGVINAETAIAYGMSGPSLRACGVPMDVRKDEPYSVYDRFDFGIPIGEKGDSWDRYYVRVMEMRQSMLIIEQALEQMPDGPTITPSRLVLRPPQGEVYVRGENPRGEIGVYLVSNGADKPYRVKVRPPSFCNLMAIKELLKGTYIADAVVILGSLDIVLGEVDR